MNDINSGEAGLPDRLCKVHVVDDAPHGVEVWLDTEVMDCDGVCIGIGKTRKQALRAAIKELEMAIDAIEDGTT